MTPQKFDELLARRRELIVAVLGSKAAEYASQTDRLHNFKRSAAFAQETSAKMCLHFLTKHLTSIADIVDAMPERPPTRLMIDEKIGDAINYLILLEALLVEAIQMFPVVANA